MSNFGPLQFSGQLAVSRETLTILQEFVDLVLHWQKNLNLISSDSTSEIWSRHILDSAQLIKFLRRQGCLLDLGSGAGFPGIVLAILGRKDVKLIESNGKKCTFLRAACRSLDLEVDVIQSRIEEYRPSLQAHYITSRALAPLEKLLGYSVPLLSPGGRCLFLKGENVGTELTQAKKNWNIKFRTHASLSDPNGVILDIGCISSIHGKS